MFKLHLLVHSEGEPVLENCDFSLLSVCSFLSPGCVVPV